MKPSRLAVDTNVLLDIANGLDDVLDAAAVIADRLTDTEQLVTPSVLEELAFLSDSGKTPQVRESARKAIRLLREKNCFRPLLELPFGEERAGELAKEFRRRQLLPDAEVHDSLILAEAVLLDCHLLLTSDEHLRAIDHQQLTWLLNAEDLTAPVIATPREIVRKFFH